jgi:hypothetical protein
VPYSVTAFSFDSISLTSIFHPYILHILSSLSADSYHHYVDGDLSILIIIFQSVIVLGCIESCRQWNRTVCTSSSNTYETTTTTTSAGVTKANPKRNTAPLSLHYTTSSLCAGLFFSAMLVTGMVALHYNTLSMIIVSRNVANLVLMVGDYIAFRKHPDLYVATIYNILLAGAIIAALNQHTFYVTQVGLLWMIANCICTAVYILCMKQFITTTYPTQSSACNNYINGSIPLTQQQVSFTSSGPSKKIPGMIYSIIYIHNALCILFLLPAAYLLGEVSLFVESTAIHTTEYASKTVVAGVLCFIFNYALLNCVGQQSTHVQYTTNVGIHKSAHSQQMHRRPSISELRSKNVLV